MLTDTVVPAWVHSVIWNCNLLFAYFWYILLSTCLPRQNFSSCRLYRYSPWRQNECLMLCPSRVRGVTSSPLAFSKGLGVLGLSSVSCDAFLRTGCHLLYQQEWEGFIQWLATTQGRILNYVSCAWQRPARLDFESQKNKITASMETTKESGFLPYFCRWYDWC